MRRCAPWIVIVIVMAVFGGSDMGAAILPRLYDQGAGVLSRGAVTVAGTVCVAMVFSQVSFIGVWTVAGPEPWIVRVPAVLVLFVGAFYAHVGGYIFTPLSRDTYVFVAAVTFLVHYIGVQLATSRALARRNEKVVAADASVIILDVLLSYEGGGRFPRLRVQALLFVPVFNAVFVGGQIGIWTLVRWLGLRLEESTSPPLA